MVTRRLTSMSEDEQRVIADALCNPLNPRVAVNLCSTCQSLHELMHTPLQQLRERHHAASALCVQLGTSCEAVLGSSRLNWRFNSLGPPDCHVVSMLFHSSALASLKDLHLDGNPLMDDGMGTLAAGLVPGAMPALTSLVCIDTQLGDRAAADLGRAIARRGLPALKSLNLNHNQISDSGVHALATGLRSVALEVLMLDTNQIGDCGLGLLVRPRCPQPGECASRARPSDSGGLVCSVSCPSVPRHGGPALHARQVSEAVSLSALKHLSLSANQARPSQ